MLANYRLLQTIALTAAVVCLTESLSTTEPTTETIATAPTASDYQSTSSTLTHVEYKPTSIEQTRYTLCKVTFTTQQTTKESQSKTAVVAVTTAATASATTEPESLSTTEPTTETYSTDTYSTTNDDQLENFTMIDVEHQPTSVAQTHEYSVYVTTYTLCEVALPIREKITESKSKTAVIAGVVCGVGGALILTLVVVAIYIQCKRRSAAVDSWPFNDQQTKADNDYGVLTPAVYEEPKCHRYDSLYVIDVEAQIASSSTANIDGGLDYGSVELLENAMYDSGCQQTAIATTVGAADASKQTLAVDSDYGGVTLVDNDFYAASHDENTNEQYSTTEVTLVDNDLYNEKD